MYMHVYVCIHVFLLMYLHTHVSINGSPHLKCIRIMWKGCKNNFLGPTLSGSDSVYLSWSPRYCVSSNKFLGGANAAGPGPLI